MEFSKPAKLLLGMFIGFCVLSVLAVVGLMMLFPATYRSVTSNSSQTPTEDSVAPSTGGGVVSDGKDLLYPNPYPTQGGDGSKLIKSSTISLSVNDLDKSSDEIKKLVAEKKGFVQSLSDSGTSNERSVSISIRVPSTSFDEVLTKVKAMGVEVLKVSEGSDDISAVYSDVKARLKTQKALEQQLLALLNKATKVSDILEIQTQLTNTRSQIEIYESEIKSYDSQVDMSVLYITMTKASVALDVNGDNWMPAGVFKEALTALVSFGKGVISVSIWVLVFSPVLLVPVGLVWYATRKRK